ncbi:MAG: DsbC family protein [Gammaproteobacteria bacterium]|nr:DsbC family protein [Gammaproteobacteria bacterium]
MDRTVYRAGWLIGVVGLLCVQGALADLADGGQKLAQRLQTLRPGIEIRSVSDTPIPGIYALEIGGSTIYYGTEDGRYLFAGDLYELGDTELVNLAEAGRVAKRQALMAEVALEDMVVFAANGETKAVVSVFTDVDCGFCQKLHLEVPTLNTMGIEVRYLAFPRAGIGSRSYDKIVSAWCADDPNRAITRLKAGKTIASVTCENPVAAQFDLGRRLGVTGTPSIVLEDGRLLAGYLPADQLAKTVGIGDGTSAD